MDAKLRVYIKLQVSRKIELILEKKCLLYN